MKRTLLIILGLLALSCMTTGILLWKRSLYPDIETGQMYRGLSEIFWGVFLVITVVMAGINWYKK